MAVNIGADFASVSAEFEHTPTTPVFNTADPEVTVQAQIDPNMVLHQAENAQFMQYMPNVFEGPQQQGLLGDMLGAVESFANDIAEVGQQVQQAVNPNAAVPNGGVLDTSLTQAETKFTHEAQIQEAAPAPSVA